MTEKKKILIADDDKMIHMLFGDHFDSRFEVLHAYDGADTLMAAMEHQPDLILLDIMMPLLDGRTLCRKLKSNDRTSGIKIVMVSGKSDQLDRLVGFEVGADEYVEKPVSLDHLSRVIDKVLRGSQA